MTSTDAAGVRPTKQRRAVAAALDAFDDFRSAQEIHALLRERGESVGLSTVYRTLQTLADADEIDSLRTENGESIYRRCSATHHHHLVCRSCGATVEVEGPAVERWTSAIASEHGYTDVSHTLELFGTCGNLPPGVRAPAPGLTRPVGTALAVALVVTTAGCRSDRRDLDDLAATARSAADEVAGRIGGRVETITDELTGAACSASGDPRGPRSLSYLLRVDTDRADPLAAARAAAADLPRSADGGWRVREREDAPGGDDLLALVGPDVTVTVVVRADPDEPVDVVAGTDCVG